MPFRLLPLPISSLAMLAKWRNVMDIPMYDAAAKGWPVWNAGKQVGAKRALKSEANLADPLFPRSRRLDGRRIGERRS